MLGIAHPDARATGCRGRCSACAPISRLPAAVTGVVMSGYYVGLLVGSLRVPTLVARVGHVRVFAALLSLGSTAILFQALFVEPVAWFLMRLLDRLLLRRRLHRRRELAQRQRHQRDPRQLLSLYMVVQMGGMAAGQFLLNLADPRGFDLFILVSVLISVAAVPMLLTAVAAPTVSRAARHRPAGTLPALAPGRGRHRRRGCRQQRPVQPWARSTPTRRACRSPRSRPSWPP